MMYAMMQATVASVVGVVAFAVLGAAVIGLAVLVRQLVQRQAGLAADATRRLSAVSAALAAAETERARLRNALDALPEGVVIADASGAIVFRNAAAERYHEARHSDAVTEGLIERLLARARVGESVEEELSLFGPPRSVLAVRAVPLGRKEASEEVSAAVARVRDVTEIRRIEQMRRDFVANVSHELKTPIGALELLSETVAACDDPAVQRRLVGQIVTEAERLGRIVDDLLDLSLIEAQEVPNRQQVPVSVLVDEAVERVRAIAQAREIALQVDAADDVVIDCDAMRVIGALVNLLDNAIKYSDPGQVVRVVTTAEGDCVQVAVIDQGIGIPASDIDRVFERFYRVDKARSRATGGTGLGLAIVRHVAHLHGGEVSVTSREGEGSTFRFSLPRRVATRPADLVMEPTLR